MTSRTRLTWGLEGLGGRGSYLFVLSPGKWNAESYPKMEDATPKKTYLRETPIHSLRSAKGLCVRSARGIPDYLAGGGVGWRVWVLFGAGCVNGMRIVFRKPSAALAQDGRKMRKVGIRLQLYRLRTAHSPRTRCSARSTRTICSCCLLECGVVPKNGRRHSDKNLFA